MKNLSSPLCFFPLLSPHIHSHPFFVFCCRVPLFALLCSLFCSVVARHPVPKVNCNKHLSLSRILRSFIVICLTTVYGHHPFFGVRERESVGSRGMRQAHSNRKSAKYRGNVNNKNVERKEDARVPPVCVCVVVYMVCVLCGSFLLTPF
jgi:hypothetical protein